ncbi:hypothetical protein ACE6H2_017049 [Prunus campanulata]
MCKALAWVLEPPPSILGLLPPIFCICFVCFGMFAILSLIISPSGDVLVFMEAVAMLLWRLVVFLILGILGRGFRFDSRCCDEFDT